MTSLADFLTRHRTILAVVGVLAMVAGAWMGATAYATPVNERTTRETSAWSESASYTYAVPVTRNSTHYPIGTTLPMGQPAYFRTVSDTILVTHNWTPRLPADARGVAAASMVVRVVGEDREGRPYWTIEHPLGSSSTNDIAVGLTVSGFLDLDALTNEVATLERELPLGEGMLNWSVQSTVVWAIDAAGQQEQGESTYTLPILANDPRFVLPSASAITWDRPHTETETITTSHPAGTPGLLRSLRSIGALIGGAALLLAIAMASMSRGGNEGFDREYRRHREWVSLTAGIPETARKAASLVEVGSLEDLVHVASDARTRVLLDATTREFYALLPGVTYRYGRHMRAPF